MLGHIERFILYMSHWHKREGHREELIVHMSLRQKYRVMFKKVYLKKMQNSGMTDEMCNSAFPPENPVRILDFSGKFIN